MSRKDKRQAAAWTTRKAREAADNLGTRLRCPWCGKQPVALKRGRLVSHVTPGNIRCVGIGHVPPN